MSIWNDKPKFDDSQPDYSNSKFLDKRLLTEKSMTLTFVGLLEKMQRPETPEAYKTDTGTTWMFEFKDSAGKEYELEQKNERGLFYREMQAQAIEPGEVVTITREGTGTDTVWTVTRAGSDVKPEVSTEEAPF